MKKSKKKLSIVAFIIGIMLSMIVIYLSPPSMKKKENLKEKHKVVFNFEDENLREKDIEVHTEEFIPDKLTLTVDNEDKSELIQIDTSQLNLNKIGTYEVKYYAIYDNSTYEQIQTIHIIDIKAPVITLIGNEVTLLIGEEYEEPGYEVEDNYDEDLKDKVEIKNEINNNQEGTYKITYKVKDTSGNFSEVEREVKVKKPNVVVESPPKEQKIETPKVVESSYTNTIKNNKFSKNDIILEGYIKDVKEENKISLSDGDTTIDFPLTMNDNNYQLNLNPDSIGNGAYKMYINGEPLLNKMAEIERIVRAKVGGKLVTLNYNNDEVSITITNHEYLYDILINPGHGGSDTGAVNKYISEKEMNLKVSMYEKCRYESHGLRVYMTRTSDTYGDKMGPSKSIALHKVAYEMGYYGAVSKIVYSNHHNSIGNNYYGGYEILVAGALTSDELRDELAIASKWNHIFHLTENHTRFYARDYVTERIYSKLNGEIYSFKDNYAVNRIPYQISNVKSIIYEGCYMSNKDEFKWYWQNKNWYHVSEAKIEVYVNSLGIPYNSDNSSCL